ncbi:Xre family transcriptional regulator [Roseivirga pacifica]|uniref:Transcriptional regulator, XRE family n=1 Tax=Roseivirga pacifica TaxID=1267423 RepID=A0A1I0NTD1_9BACT|nr:helix-turn-helix transcriptional regulator [Roseivirga pacifica]RKQ51436.1 Xre family transcriptional regulator [Roseivirga pacifica]SEW04730.1 transcriptional regulator, XRE family [Roseivirga pacifica]
MNDNSYMNWSSMSDKAINVAVGGFVKHHRQAQQMTQDMLAKAAGISRSTLSLLERGESVNFVTLIQVLRVLELLHVMEAFSVKEEISPLAYAKLKKKQQQRVRRSKKSNESKEDLGW